MSTGTMSWADWSQQSQSFVRIGVDLKSALLARKDCSQICPARIFGAENSGPCEGSSLGSERLY